MAGVQLGFYPLSVIVSRGIRTQGSRCTYFFGFLWLFLLSLQYLWFFKMAAENVRNEVKQFHEFSLDDRLLKVENVL